MRPKRDFRPQQLYAITQRGNQGQWVYRDAEDFTKALDFIRKYATLHQVAVHGWCLLHNHDHWIFEASTTDSISNLMRDMQSRYSHYLNVKYRATPWLLIAPLFGCKDLDHFSPYLRMGPAITPSTSTPPASKPSFATSKITPSAPAGPAALSIGLRVMDHPGGGGGEVS